jgi:hypothetical protein
MAKKDIIIQEEINRINGIMRNAKLIREGFYLEDEDEYPVADDETYDDSDVPVEEPEGAVQPAPEENEDPTKSLGGDFVNKIRAITLDGMKQLNNTPEDPRFQALLKIFNICNKAVDDQKEQQQPQKPAM